MSGFKKLRLDPETPIQGTHRNLSLNQPGANDGGGRSYMDNSSFSSSTSGGSGTYARSAGPFRTRYSQPLRIPSPSSPGFSRFSPYYFGKERRSTLKVPLIRARRDESDSDNIRPSSRASLNSSLGGDSTSSATTSTAQRIIETLQNLSTPVMNAGKIRIDQDIKAVQPLPFGSGSSLSRYSPGSPMNRSSGPPKMCSSLLLSTPSSANQISPVSNIGDQRRLFCIPKMIDAATNTEKEVDTTSPSQLHKSYRAGADFKTAAPSSTATSKSMYGGHGMSGPASKSVATARDDNSDEEFHECSSDFAFSRAWAPQVFDPYFSKEKDDKSSDKRTSQIGQQQPSILNGYKEPTPSTSAMFSAPNKNTPSDSPSSVSTPKATAGSSGNNFPSFPGSGGQFGFGTSPSPMKSALSSQGKQTESSSASKQSTSSPQESSLGGGKSTPALSSFKFGSQISTDHGSAPIKTTFDFEKDGSKDDKKAATTSFDKVDAAKNDNSSANSAAKASLPPIKAKDSGLKWSCPTCMVKNELEAQACVCCGEKNPKQTDSKIASTGGSLSTSKKWRCPTCMVDNEFKVAACMCCSEKNPNAEPTLAAPKWRCPTCMVENDSVASTCVCCSEKNPSSSGEKKDEALPSAASTSTFKFGISAPTGAGTTSGPGTSSGNSSFVFGQPASTEKSSLSAFKFGAPAVTTTTSISSVAPSAPSVVPAVPVVTTSVPSTKLSSPPATNTFTFGNTLTPATTLPSSTPTPSFGFGSSLATTSQPAVTTNVPTTTAPVFGISKPTSATAITATSTPPASNSIFGSTTFQPASSVSQPVSSPSFNITGAPTTTINPQKAAPAPSFTFGSSLGAKPSFGTFGFGNSPAQSQGTAQSTAPSSILSSNPQVSISAPAPSIGTTPSFSFGSNASSATSPFGQPLTNPTLQPSAPIFQFGGGTPNRMNPSPAPSPTPSFNMSMTPNLNFGAPPSSSIPPLFGNSTQPNPNAGSQQPPTLFQFNAAPTPSDSPGGRRIKKAVRRFNK